MMGVPAGIVPDGKTVGIAAAPTGVGAMNLALVSATSAIVIQLHFTQLNFA